MKWTTKFQTAKKKPVKVHVVNSFCPPERLIPDPMRNTADPDPGVVVPDPGAVIPA